jgi:hypothetical protein
MDIKGRRAPSPQVLAMHPETPASTTAAPRKRQVRTTALRSVNPSPHRPGHVCRRELR